MACFHGAIVSMFEPRNFHFFMKKSCIFSVLAFFRQHRNYGNNAKIQKKLLSNVLYPTYLTYLSDQI